MEVKLPRTNLVLHFRRPSLASSISLAATCGTVLLLGCAEWDMQTRAEAATRLAASGDYARALISVLPFPWAMPVAGLVAVAGHVAATVVRRGTPGQAASTPPAPQKSPENQA